MAEPTRKHVSLAHARDHLSALVNDAAHGHQRIVLSSRGRPKAALIGIEDLERLEGTDAEATILEREMLRDRTCGEGAAGSAAGEEVVHRGPARGAGGAARRGSCWWG